MHDVTIGPKPTAVKIAEAQTTNTCSTFFGFLAIADDPLTVGPDPGSKLVGKVQVLYGFSDQKEVAVKSGVFKFARGFADLKKYSLDNKTGNAVVEYNIFFVFHY
ncbi:Dirigent protein [Vigna angularis]|uniref:Dirigent protein n=1 Tax=Phaseolus angularis TaxID=3914 RepID=A0A8T0KZB4_PHAAN|nr:Dirigent protein [Vigna angularis]